MDYIMNGRGFGGVAQLLIANGMNTDCLRPWIGHDGRHRMTVNQQGKPKTVFTNNATATLRKDEWILLDQAVIRAAKPRLGAWQDLIDAGLTYDIPNGMAKTVLQHQTQSDITEATVSMDGLRESDQDRPTYELASLPLPIIHKDFSFSAREVMVSQNGGSPLDTTTAELAARRVAEMAEKLLLGVSTGTSYGGGQIFGYTNFDHRLTKSITKPTTAGWNPQVTVNEVLAMKQQSQLAYHYGPWKLYCSPNWDAYMDDDYSAAKGINTLRQRLAMIDKIVDVKTIDYLTTGTTDFSLLLVQQTPDVVRAVTGMNITTVQWETRGGMELNFKVMAIMVPQLRADVNGNTGIVHGS